MRDREPPGIFLRSQDLMMKSAWIKGAAVSTGGIILFCCCLTILTVSSCTLGN